MLANSLRKGSVKQNYQKGLEKGIVEGENNIIRELLERGVELPDDIKARLEKCATK